MSTPVAGKRYALTAAEKKRICELHKQNSHWTHERVREEASKLLNRAINRPMVSKILRDSSRWLSISEADGSRKRLRAIEYEQIEEALVIWYKQVTWTVL